MYEQLLNADVVIADVSTYNPNAFYELGVRHALKPYTTITIAEDKLVFPFDVGQIAIRTYHHLGEGIDFGEVERMRGELTKAIKIVGDQAACDSPVYTFLRDLRPPLQARAEVERALGASPQADSASQPTIRALMDQADAAFDKSDFVTAKSLLAVVRTMMPMDNYVAQRLALATYKSKLPTAEAALNEAAAILETLSPTTSTDTETLGLFGAVHKRLWDATQATPHLDKAIWAHEKGFYVRNDYYNGINLAFLLNVRSALNSTAEPAEAIADFVIAQRVRRRVLALCQALLDSTAAPKGADWYWIQATMAEAYAGLGDEKKAQAMLNDARSHAGVADWMLQSTQEQLGKLKGLLAQSPLGKIGAATIA
jgi:tetratricopeptide (TPR) repeat protein